MQTHTPLQELATEFSKRSANNEETPHFVLALESNNRSTTSVVHRVVSNKEGAMKALKLSGVLSDKDMLDFATEDGNYDVATLLSILEATGITDWDDFTKAYFDSQEAHKDLMPALNYLSGKEFTERLMKITGDKSVSELSKRFNVPSSTFVTWNTHNRTGYELACRISIYTGVPVRDLLLA